MTSGKTLGVKIMIANTIALFIIFTTLTYNSAISYNINIPESANGTPQYNPQSGKITGWNTPTTGIEQIDWLLAFYFGVSYALAVWLIFNPFSG